MSKDQQDWMERDLELERAYTRLSRADYRGSGEAVADLLSEFAETRIQEGPVLLVDTVPCDPTTYENFCTVTSRDFVREAAEELADCRNYLVWAMQSDERLSGRLKPALKKVVEAFELLGCDREELGLEDVADTAEFDRQAEVEAEEVNAVCEQRSCWPGLFEGEVVPDGPIMCEPDGPRCCLRLTDPEAAALCEDDAALADGDARLEAFADAGVRSLEEAERYQDVPWGPPEPAVHRRARIGEYVRTCVQPGDRKWAAHGQDGVVIDVDRSRPARLRLHGEYTHLVRYVNPYLNGAEQWFTPAELMVVD